MFCFFVRGFFVLMIGDVADTAYVLAYSVVMLNTDQHSPQVKKRMTKEEFRKNNRGIDGGQDISAAVLEAIYDEIQANEIVMKDEQAAKADKTATPDRSAERKVQPASKAEAIFTSMARTSRPTSKRSSAVSTAGFAKDMAASYFSASQYEHVKPMFQIIWMSVLTGLSTPLQESEDVDTIIIALEGFKHASRIACLFDMELERKAFVSTLSKFTQLGNVHDMRSKNLEATKVLLEIGGSEGNALGDSWKDVVLCVSQLEKLQVLGAQGGEGEAGKSRLVLNFLFFLLMHV